MPDPITPEQRLAEIRDRDERALRRAEDPAFSLSQAECDRTLLLNEVDRLNARIVTYDRLNRVAIGDWEREVDRLKAELKANRQHWYHNDQSRTECVAGFDPETRECAEGGGKVFSEVEHQAQLIEIWTDLTRSYERDVARLTSERDRLKAANKHLERDWESRGNRVLKLGEELRAAEGKLWAAAQVRVRTNEDGKRFVFADDLCKALGVPSGGEAS